MNIQLSFRDSNGIDLDQGVAVISLSGGKVKYQEYQIEEYRNQAPVLGRHVVIHEESYLKAFNIVKPHGSVEETKPLPIRGEIVNGR